MNQIESIGVQFLPPLDRPGVVPVVLAHDDNTDAAQILRTLAQLIDRYKVDPLVRESALRIGAPVWPNDTSRLYDNLQEWVRARVLYVPDPAGEEFFITPDRLLLTAAGFVNPPQDQYELSVYETNLLNGTRQAHGDCDDFVLLLGSLLAAVGFTVRPAAVRINGSPWYNHVILQVLDNRPPGAWIDIDATTLFPLKYKTRLIVN